MQRRRSLVATSENRKLSPKDLGGFMTNLIECSAAAYSCPLLIKHLLNSALLRAPEQEIVYRTQARFSYRDFRDRVGRLASGLAKLGVQSGNTVGVMDLDSHRYLECFFAVPMMGATLHTINVRLSPEQILYTINHAKDDVILVNGEFLPILEKVWDRVEGVKALVLLDDAGERPKTTLPLAADYETLLAGADPDFVFPDLDEDTRATTFYTTGTTGLPKGVYFSHRQLVLHTMALRNAITGSGHGRLNDGDVYMPVTPMFHVHAWGFPYVATTLGLKQVYLGRYSPDLVLDLSRARKSRSPTASRPSCR
jgi:acyl-CoA synthetase (AMP-forming)/AMP-acid ligase II